MPAKGKTVWDELTDLQKKEIGEAARVGCTDKHIAQIMGMAETPFLQCNKLRSFTAKKRALWRQSIRIDQAKHSKNTPVGAIWLGKQELGQSDKQDVNHGVDEATASLLGLIDGATRGKLPAEEEDHG